MFVQRVSSGEGVFIVNTGVTPFIRLRNFILEIKILEMFQTDQRLEFAHSAVALRSIRPDHLLRARLDLWEMVDRVQSFERANAGHLKKALEVVQRSADGRRSG